MKTLKIVFAVIILFFIVNWKGVDDDSEVKWITFEQAIELNKKNPKKLLIDIYTDWCGWCKVMDKNTYGKVEIAEYINKNFYPVKFNAEQRASIEFDGRTFEYVTSGRRGVHQLAVSLTSNQLSYPTTVFLNEKLEIIQPVSGYLKPNQMKPILLFIGEDYYTTTSWEEFKKSGKTSF